MSDIVLESSDLGFWYHADQPILTGATFKVATGDRKGHVVAVVGESGAGKTSLLRLLAGLNHQNTGRISLSPPNATIAYLPQQPILFAHLSVWENAHYYRRIAAHRNNYDESRVTALIGLMKLDTRMNNGTIARLSGGEQQRLALVRELSIQPRLLLLDEPCTGLDSPVRYDLLFMLRQVADEQRLIVFYVTHHADEARLIADDLLYLHSSPTYSDGRVTCKTVAAFLAQPPTLSAAQMLAEGPLNVLPCAVDSGTIRIRSTRAALGRLPDTVDIEICWLAFPPTCVVSGPNSELAIAPVGSSNRVWFVRTRCGVELVMSRLAYAEVPATVSINGSALLFRDVHSEALRVELLPLA